MKQAGFSLIEILMVIAIIGILIGTALPAYQRYTKRAHFTQITQSTLPLKLAVTECYQMTFSLAHCQSGQNGIPAFRHNNNQHQLLSQLGVKQNGIIEASPKPKYGFDPTDTYQLIPTVTQGHLHWHSAGPAVEKGYAK